MHAIMNHIENERLIQRIERLRKGSCECRTGQWIQEQVDKEGRERHHPPPDRRAERPQPRTPSRHQRHPISRRRQTPRSAEEEEARHRYQSNHIHHHKGTQVREGNTSRTHRLDCGAAHERCMEDRQLQTLQLRCARRKPRFWRITSPEQGQAGVQEYLLLTRLRRDAYRTVRICPDVILVCD